MEDPIPTPQEYAEVSEAFGYEDFAKGVRSVYTPFFHGTISIRSEVYKPKEQILEANFNASVRAGSLGKEEQEKIARMIGTYETILEKWRACYEEYQEERVKYKDLDSYIKDSINPELKRADELYGDFTEDEVEYKVYAERLWYELTEEEQRLLAETSKPLHDDHQDHLRAMKKGGQIVRRDTCLNEDLSDVASEEEQKARKSQLLGMVFTETEQQVQINKEENHEQNL